MSEISLIWLRNDLRINDNPALAAALDHPGTVRREWSSATPIPIRLSI